MPIVQRIVRIDRRCGDPMLLQRPDGVARPAPKSIESDRSRKLASYGVDVVAQSFGLWPRVNRLGRVDFAEIGQHIRVSPLVPIRLSAMPAGTAVKRNGEFAAAGKAGRQRRWQRSPVAWLTTAHVDLPSVVGLLR